MHNAAPPPDHELPSTFRLIRSTVISIAAAAVILVTVVLPAEYAIDPTGIGRALGLTSMGEIKQQLEKDAKEHSAAPPRGGERPDFFASLGGLLIGSASAQTAKTAPGQLAQAKDTSPWKDEVTFSLRPGQGMEIKLTMKKGDTATYSWAATDGRINYDLHAHAGGQTARYRRGRGKRGDSGSFTARFDGDHGWFFRNRDRRTVKVLMKLKGGYSAIVRK
jgi:hypothetical protein